ncbi:hypothetical protein [Psychrobacillus psychrodurans]|uniref:Uncharacterized protein n=1 Tax=Psychrobacillus psychrodurans TaxID=126157 RepID=A0A9X3LDH2_9BACI|nr:hypothetical protein [Psychrobacillus psychrodurans]MCZ8535189.1 hypothetical protein [Psychrobacillus psychrodurans]
MDDKQLEERLNLLKSSYDRLPSSVDTEEIIRKIENEHNIAPAEKKSKGSKWQRITVWTVSIASVFIIGILGSSYILEDEKKIQQGEQMSDATKEFIEQLKKDYPIEREKKRELLNLSEEEFSQIPFIEFADSSFEHYTAEREDSFLNNHSDSNLDTYYENTMSGLILPSEMVKELNEGDKLDKAETVSFLRKYNAKLNDFKLYTNDKLDKYKKELEPYKVNGLYNINKILENEQYLPDGFRTMRDNAEMQGLQLVLIGDGIDIRFSFSLEPNYSSVFSIVLDPISTGYLQMMAQEPFTYAWELLYPMNETAQTLLDMEDYMLDEYVNEEEYGGDIMDTYYISVFYFLVKGTEENPVFDENGMVKEEYREIWNMMRNEDKISPSPYLLTPIVADFEKSGWKKSEEWDDLTYGDIENALHLAKTGDLEQFMPQGLEVQVDDEFVQRVHALYKSFAGTHNQTALKEATPEEIVGLYYYSIQLKDYETQYELYIKDDTQIQIPKDEYLNGKHQVIDDIKLEFRGLEFTQNAPGYGVVILTKQSDRRSSDENEVIGFQLIQTEYGWRPPFMPIQ